MNSNVCDEKIDCSDLAVMAGHRPTEKSYRKVFLLQKEVCRLYNFGCLYDRPTLQN